MDKHKGSFGQNCASCHNTQNWSSATFDHNLSVFKLTGAHVNTACARCHVNGVFKGTASNCYACHAGVDKHKGSFGQNCASCHNTQNWSSATFDHNLSVFKLTGAHVNTACARCHVNGVFKGTASNCYACHAGVDKHKGSFGQNCASCHNTQNWSSATFDHNLSVFKLTGAHVNTACARCHVNGVFKGTASNCYACHAGVDKHKGSFGQNCASCHNTQNWSSATFDHNLSVFKLTGAHVNTACARCHVNGVFKGTAQVCAGCHSNPAFHAGLFSGMACSTCHNTSRWSPALFTLSHPQPKGGEGGSGIKHGGASCRDCHTVNLSTATCLKCHDSNNPD